MAAQQAAESHQCFYADEKFGDVIKTLIKRGWTLNENHEQPADLFWRNLSNTPFERCSNETFVNHFEGAQHFSNKGKFTRLLGLNMQGRGEPSLPRAHALDPPPKSVRRSLSGEAKLALSVESLLRDLGTQLAVGFLRSILEHNEGRQSYDSQLVEACLGVAHRWSLQLRNLNATNEPFKHINGAVIRRPCSPSRDVLIVGGKIWNLILSHGNSVASIVRSATQRGVELSPEQLSVIDQLISDLKRFDTHFDLGSGGVWIVKPSGLSCGQGIVCHDSIPGIAQACAQLEFKAVVQKYIERPLLICHRKFDIRLWVLVTSVAPLELWVFSDCYLRLSSRAYHLNSLSDSMVHLCNFSVQKNDLKMADGSHASGEGEGKREDNQSLDIRQNMLDSRSFAAHVDGQYGSGSWHQLLRNINTCVVGSLSACQGQLKKKGRGFEWLGIDLMIIEREEGAAALRPFIIEANTSPDVSHSSAVTTQLVPQATEDLFNLLLDEHSILSPHKLPTHRQSCVFKDEGTLLSHHSCFPTVPCWQLWYSDKELLEEIEEPSGIVTATIVQETVPEVALGMPEDRSILPPRNLADLIRCVPQLDLRSATLE